MPSPEMQDNIASLFAIREAEAGVDVTLRVGDGLPHVYPATHGTPEAAEATEQSAAFLRKHLAL